MQFWGDIDELFSSQFVCCLAKLRSLIQCNKSWVKHIEIETVFNAQISCLIEIEWKFAKVSFSIL